MEKKKTKPVLSFASLSLTAQPETQQQLAPLSNGREAQRNKDPVQEWIQPKVSSEIITKENINEKIPG